MARYKARIKTNWSAEKSFDYLSDLRNLEEWDPGVSEAKLSEGNEVGANASYDVKANGANLRYRITDFERPNLVGFKAKTTFFTSIDKIYFESSHTGACVTYDAILLLNGPLKVFNFILKRYFNRLGDEAAVGLATHIDGQLKDRPV